MSYPDITASALFSFDFSKMKRSIIVETDDTYELNVSCVYSTGIQQQTVEISNVDEKNYSISFQELPIGTPIEFSASVVYSTTYNGSTIRNEVYSGSTITTLASGVNYVPLSISYNYYIPDGPVTIPTLPLGVTYKYVNNAGEIYNTFEIISDTQINWNLYNNGEFVGATPYDYNSATGRMSLTVSGVETAVMYFREYDGLLWVGNFFNKEAENTSLYTKWNCYDNAYTIQSIELNENGTMMYKVFAADDESDAITTEMKFKLNQSNNVILGNSSVGKMYLYYNPDEGLMMLGNQLIEQP